MLKDNRKRFNVVMLPETPPDEGKEQFEDLNESKPILVSGRGLPHRSLHQMRHPQTGELINGEVSTRNYDEAG